MALFEQRNIYERLDYLLRTGELSDCTFIVGAEKKPIRVHRFFLGIASPVFYAMFFGALPETSESIVIPDVTPAGFMDMLQYVYTGRIPFDGVSQVCQMLVVARKYMLRVLEARCITWLKMRLDVWNCIEISEFARANVFDELAERCGDVFAKHTSDVIMKDAFLRADVSTLQVVVDQPEIEVQSESQLFRRLEEWAAAEAERSGREVEEVAPELRSVVGRVRFLTMSFEEFSAGPANSPLLTKDEKCALIRRLSGGKVTRKRQYNAIEPKQALPATLSSETATRGQARTTGSFHATFTVRRLLRIRCGNWIYSRPPYYVANAPWRIRVRKVRSCGAKGSALVYYLSICAEDKEGAIAKPKTARIRVLDTYYNEELVIRQPGAVKEGWLDMYDCVRKEGELFLCICIVSQTMLSSCDVIRIEAAIAM